MDTGKLNRRITFQVPVSTPNAYNESVQTWEPVTTVWASIQPLKGVLLSIAQAAAITATATHSITVRYNPALKPTHRIASGNPAEPAPYAQPTKIYTINSGPLDDKDGHRTMTFLVTEVTA